MGGRDAMSGIRRMVREIRGRRWEMTSGEMGSWLSVMPIIHLAIKDDAYLDIMMLHLCGYPRYIFGIEQVRQGKLDS